MQLTSNVDEEKLKPQIVIGIDPGIHGGIAAIESGEVIFSAITPTYLGKPNWKDYDIEAMCIMLKRFDTNNSVVYLEKVSGWAGKGALGMFNFGRGVGMWEAIISLLGFRVVRVLPFDWQKIVYKDQTKINKDTGARIAKKLFPGVDLTPGKIRKPHDGITDAIMIALYGVKCVEAGVEKYE